MIPELGHFALIIALCLAIIQSIVPLLGAQTGNPAWMATARPVARAQFGFLLISFACLTWAFTSNDFSVLYVAQNSNSDLPLPYRISAVWGAHEGSLLLWSLVLGGWTFAVSVFSRSLPDAMLSRVLSVLGMISIGFMLFILWTSNPFERLLPAALEGRDLNPLLQDPGLIIHPPMLYMGYVGFSVAFAFAIAALIGGHLDAAWARWSRPWTTIAWTFLTVGIALGSWWAYYELGWGGWWFWDPVENASFMPWLVGTALIHSLAVTEKRGAFKPWTVLLAILAFALSLLGTFLVRSGVLVSVHAFATDPTRGVFILSFLVIVIGSSLVLYALRAPRVTGAGRFSGFSRETLLLANNVLLVVAAASVLLGTLYPLVLDAMGLGKISVGPPYFSSVFVPLMLPAAILAGIGPTVKWQADSGTALLKRLVPVMVLAIGSSILFLYLYGNLDSLLQSGALAAAAWVILTSLQSLWSRAARRNNGLRGLASVPRSFYGMTLAHIGIGVFIIGVTLVSSYQAERDVRVETGDKLEVSGYVFSFNGVRSHTGPNYTAQRGTIEVQKNGRHIVTLLPEKRVYGVRKNPMTEAAIDAGLFRDLYVSLGEPLGDGVWTLRVYYKPFIRWIWLGALLMALGGLLAATDRRYRVMARQPQPAVPAGNRDALAAQA